jgi:ketosteroid isomerase-like protein
MNRDTKWFERNMDDWYYSMNSDGKLLNKAQSIQAIKKDNNKYESIRLSDERVHIDGDIAMTTGIHHIKGMTPDGKTIDMKLRFMRTFKKKDGGWVAVASQSTKISDN